MASSKMAADAAADPASEDIRRGPLEAEPEETMRVRVARGRTLYLHNRFRLQHDVKDIGGRAQLVTKRVPIEGRHKASEGEYVDLPVSEAKRLLGTGAVKLEGDAETRPPSGSFAAPVDGGGGNVASRSRA